MQNTILLLLAAAACSGTLADDWPQLQHDTRHTGTTHELLAVPEGNAPLEVGWKTNFLELNLPEPIGRNEAG